MCWHAKKKDNRLHGLGKSGWETEELELLSVEGNTSEGAGCFFGRQSQKQPCLPGHKPSCTGLLELAGLSVSELQALVHAHIFGRAERDPTQTNILILQDKIVPI